VHLAAHAKEPLMIFTETREGRRFVGEVPPGLPLLASLRALTENYRIASGWFDGTGYVRDAVVRRVLTDGDFSDPQAVPGTSLLGSLRIAVSERDGKPDLVARAMLVREDGQVVAGLLDEAVSGSVEFMAQTFDDITLRRYDDPKAGLARWLDVAVHVVEGDPESVRSGRMAMEALPSRLLEPTEMPQLKVGDALQHPRLGICYVTQVVDQDRISIQMESGKIAQLHLGLLILSRAGMHLGRILYDVHVRRRN
jgi:predicted DNA-binding protein with PD1-like motif